MTKEVVLKSNKYGINLILDDKVPFEKLLELIAEKFEETGAFFKDAKMMISLEGRKLSDEEQLQIADTIMEHSDVTVVGFLDEDPLLEEKMKERLEAVYKAGEAAFADIHQKQKERESAKHFADSRASYEPSYTAPMGYAQAGFQEKGSMQPEEAFYQPQEIAADFYRGNLRSGQVLKCVSSVTLVGDVNPGAMIISDGNIVVLGSLKGNAHAGAGGDDSCFIFALDMQPIQLQIGEYIAKSPDEDWKSRKLKKKPKEQMAYSPKAALAREGTICIEPMAKGVLNY